MDTRDWIVISLMAVIEIAATVFVFKHPDAINFATWATVCGTLATAYHWIVVKDSKTPDSRG
jgi:hypothetical protein